MQDDIAAEAFDKRADVRTPALAHHQVTPPVADRPSQRDLGRSELDGILEVLKAVASKIGIAWGKVESVAASKRAERRGFDGGFWMTLR